MKLITTDLAAKFGTAIEETLSLAANTESLWLTSPPAAEVRQKLKSRQIEALYEAVYLRMFAYWEAFLEDLSMRWLAGYRSASYVPVPNGGRLCRTLGDSFTQLATEGGQVKDYLLWHNPQAVQRRLHRCLVGSPLEVLVAANTDEFSSLAAIRHNIAHRTPDTSAKYRSAAQRLTGVSYSGSPGHMLRASDISDPLNQPKWILQFSRVFENHAYALCS